MKSLTATAILFCLALFGCGGGGSSTPTDPTPTQTIPNMAGSWEIVTTSNTPPPSGVAAEETLYEVNFAQSGSQVSVKNGGNGVQFSPNNPNPSQLFTIGLQFFNASNDYSNFGYQMGGFCSQYGYKTLSGSITASGQVTMTLDEGGNTFTGTGNLSQDGSTITGTYTGGAPSCNDAGSFTAKRTSSLSGKYANNQLGDPSLTATLTENSDCSLSVAGYDSTDGNFTLTGWVPGNAAEAMGTVSGTQSIYYGLFVPHGDYGASQNLPLLVVIDQTNNLIGILIKQ